MHQFLLRFGCVFVHLDKKYFVTEFPNYTNYTCFYNIKRFSLILFVDTYRFGYIRNRHRTLNQMRYLYIQKYNFEFFRKFSIKKKFEIFFYRIFLGCDPFDAEFVADDEYMLTFHSTAFHAVQITTFQKRRNSVTVEIP